MIKNEDNNSPPIPAANMEPNISHAPLGKEETERLDSLVNITVISYRKRKHDPDGISCKACLDGLVRYGLLRDDSTEEVGKVTFESRKCAKGDEEATIIELEWEE